MELAEKNLEADPYARRRSIFSRTRPRQRDSGDCGVALENRSSREIPKDTKVMHELGEHYISMGSADKPSRYTRKSRR